MEAKDEFSSVSEAYCGGIMDGEILEQGKAHAARFSSSSFTGRFRYT